MQRERRDDRRDHERRDREVREQPAGADDNRLCDSIERAGEAVARPSSALDAHTGVVGGCGTVKGVPRRRRDSVEP